MVGNVAFRSAAFGGFKREDVMEYVEQSTREHREMVDHLQSELDDAQRRADQLSAQNDALQERMESQQSKIRSQILALQNEYQQVVNERDDLRDRVEQLEDMERQMNNTERKFGTLTSMNDQQRKELTRLQSESKAKDEKLDQQEKEIASLQVLVSQMQRESESYRAMCRSIGEIEIDMRYRTSRMEKEAQQRIDDRLAEAQATYDNILANASVDARAVRDEVESRLNEIKTNLNTTSNGLTDALTSALGEIAQIQMMMENLNGCLDDHVTQINSLAMGPIALLDDQPEEAPADADEVAAE